MQNAKASDAQFILKKLAENSERAAPSVIISGQNITMLKYGRTKFIDSINYFQMKLSALPATFGLPESSKKGYVPYFFNIWENQRYVGALPAIEFYDPDTMAPAERAAFLDWYENTSTGYIVDFQKEIVEYCQMDVEILKRACVQFRKIFLEVGETDLFIAPCTIALACYTFYVQNF